MTVADDLAVVVAGLRPVAEDLAFSDTCQIKRDGAPVTDSRGNKTYPEVTIATVRCLLQTGGLRPDERLSADRMTSITPYSIKLPYPTAAKPPDVLVVNGSRRFEVIGVLEGGLLSGFATAVVEERT